MDDSNGKLQEENPAKQFRRFVKLAALFSGGGCFVALGIFVVFLVVLIFLGIINIDNDDVASNRDTGECGFTISMTSLSKNEFKQKIQEYANSHSQWKVFADYADQYYDYAVSKGVNPELVVLVASKENNGYDFSQNNYWGLKCPNGSKSCGSYGSFMQGAEALIDSAARYDSLYDWFVAGSYSYIGYFWYNPGNWGDGGCVYSSYIYPDNMPSYVSKACGSGASTCLCIGVNCGNDQSLRNQWLSTGVNPRPECEPTRDEDQVAYATWLIKEKMGVPRKTIFGLDFEEGPCSGSNMNSLDSYNLNGEGLKVLDRTLSSSEISELNNYLDQELKKSGHGTGLAVATAGQSLVYWLEQKGYKLGYFWAGGHGYGGDSTIMKANPDWGSTKFGVDTHNGNYRPYYGMDCSGFVSWATRLGCKADFGAPSSGSWPSYGKKLSSFKDAQPGDVLADADHIILVVKNNGNSLIVAEETGSKGLIFREITSSNHPLYSMKDWYSKNCTDIHKGTGFNDNSSDSSSKSSGNGKILLIAGHSYSPYCNNASNECREDESVYGYSEPVETRKLVRLLKSKLIGQGFKDSEIDIVNELLGEDFNDSSTSKSLYVEAKNNTKAFKKLNLSKYKFAIEIHFNASEGHSASGVQSPCLSGGCGLGSDVTAEIRSAVNGVLGNGDLGTWTESLTDLNLFKDAKVPFTYLETEFYDNKKAMDNYSKHKNDVALAIAKVIRKHYK